MKAPGLEDRLVDVTAYLTDETFGYDHWRASQLMPPPSDHKRAALLLIATADSERPALRALVEGALAQRDGTALAARPVSLARISDAAERIQAAAYDLPDSRLRGLLIADSVVVLQELARLVAAKECA